MAARGLDIPKVRRCFLVDMFRQQFVSNIKAKLIQTSNKNIPNDFCWEWKLWFGTCQVSHVINYDLPHNIDSYVHRIGQNLRALEDWPLNSCEICCKRICFEVGGPSKHHCSEQNLGILKVPIFEHTQMRGGQS